MTLRFRQSPVVHRQVDTPGVRGLRQSAGLIGRIMAVMGGLLLLAAAVSAV